MFFSYDYSLLIREGGLSIQSRVSSDVLIFLDKAGVFYFILSVVFALSGEMDESSLYLLLLSSFFGLILVVIERYKQRKISKVSFCKKDEL